MMRLIWNIEVSYKVLKSLFWKPIDWDWEKVDAEWKIDTKWGECRIYNYKDWVNYCWKKEWTPKTKITDWHIWWTQEIQFYYILSKIREFQVYN